ncbi:GPI mannosyltransferase 4 [Condylostylus longicornis]|uniref:GPI mannosyltransferase 4 n=1 Tax=Condylostylus longicornis TaxID=2530218 RepID=UPI00244E3151|nr:GPI mannosyltransferase 4 [Condylostylus longicornis]
MKLSKYIETLIIRAKRNDKHFYTYITLVIIRILLIFVPQTGYIHPDEFFQSVEIMTGEQFEIEHTRTWEFNNTFPIRSMVVPYFLLKVPLNFIDFLSTYSKYYLEIDLRSSYMILIFPRMIMCAISFVNDYSIYKICEAYSLRYEIRLLALGSSFIMLTFATRTFSNTIEMAICSLITYYVADCMIHSNTVIYKKEFLQDRYKKAESISEKVKIWKLKRTLPAHNYNKYFSLSILCVIGVFNRPTFLVFGAPMVFFWLLRGMGTKTVNFFDFNIRMLLFVISSIPTICFCILVDSLYYRYLTTGEIHMLQITINNFVVTPLNFLKYNLDPEKTAEHGIHPKYLHLLVNIPMLYNILGIIAISSFIHLIYSFLRGMYQDLPRSQSIVGLMTAAIFTPVMALSLINHQEPRFLIPITLPILLLHSPKLVTGFCQTYPFKNQNKILYYIFNNFLSTRASAKFILNIWYITNIFLTIFFGFIHQGGVYQLARYFSNSMHAKPSTMNIHLITSNIYMMPLSIVNIPSSHLLLTNSETGKKYRRSKDFYLYEYGSLEIDKLLKKIKIILDVNEMKFINKKKIYRMYLAVPTSLAEDLNIGFQKFPDIKYEQVKVFYPHLSTEALPKIFGRHPCDLHVDFDNLQGTCDIENKNYFSFSYILKQFSSIVHQFGLALYRIEIVTNSKASTLPQQ